MSECTMTFLPCRYSSNVDNPRDIASNSSPMIWLSFRSRNFSRTEGGASLWVQRHFPSQNITAPRCGGLPAASQNKCTGRREGAAHSFNSVNSSSSASIHHPNARSNSSVATPLRFVFWSKIGRNIARPSLLNMCEPPHDNCPPNLLADPAFSCLSFMALLITVFHLSIFDAAGLYWKPLGDIVISTPSTTRLAPHCSFFGAAAPCPRTMLMRRAKQARACASASGLTRAF